MRITLCHPELPCVSSQMRVEVRDWTPSWMGEEWIDIEKDLKKMKPDFVVSVRESPALANPPCRLSVERLKARQCASTEHRVRINEPGTRVFLILTTSTTPSPRSASLTVSGVRRLQPPTNPWRKLMLDVSNSHGMELIVNIAILAVFFASCLEHYEQTDAWTDGIEICTVRIPLKKINRSHGSRLNRCSLAETKNSKLKLKWNKR